MHRQTLRDRMAADREAKRQYVEDQLENAADQSAALEERVAHLERILVDGLAKGDRIDFDSLRVSDSYPPFDPPLDLLRGRLAPDREAYRAAVLPLGPIARLFAFNRRRHEALLLEADASFERDAADHSRLEADRLARLESARKAYEAARFESVWAATQRNSEVAEFSNAYSEGKPFAIVSCTEMVLTRSVYPDDFPQEFRLAYVAESRELVVDYQLPTLVVVPAVSEVRYVKTKDHFEEKPRKPTEVKELYQDVVAAVTLRTLHEVFAADQGGHVDVVTFSGFVRDVSPATGRDIRPYLVSVRTTREKFAELDLGRVNMRVCLRNLGAQVSPRADELVPVKPVVEFDMVDKRFVDQIDVVSELDARPNIMDLSPFEFENLVGNVFEKLGLDTRQTRASRDGGVDVVAYDTRPVLGGKVVIQAKRYRNTVGVAAVRDLFGTMMNEGAKKGILVATSGYGADAFEFAKDKPIELIDGGQLLYLCDQVGVHARIIMPSE
jgi:restriction system protein